jgi:hypothetical protein
MMSTTLIPLHRKGVAAFQYANQQLQINLSKAVLHQKSS